MVNKIQTKTNQKTQKNWLRWFKILLTNFGYFVLSYSVITLVFLILW